MEEERREHVMKMKKMEAEMEQVFEMKVKEKKQKLKDSEAEVSLSVSVFVREKTDTCAPVLWSTFTAPLYSCTVTSQGGKHDLTNV